MLLEAEFPGLISRSAQVNELALNATVTSTNYSSGRLDLTSVIKAAQALSGEIVLENLLRTLMNVVLENAGAHHGYLILKDGEAVLHVRANGTIDKNGPRFVPCVIDDFKGEMSVAIVKDVVRTREDVVIADAGAMNGIHDQDEYIFAKRPKSILCIPISRKEQLIGVLYLENNLSTGVFTSERVELLKILSSQMAISIENAQLYNALEEKVKERTRQLEQVRQAEDAVRRLNDELERRVLERTAQLSAVNKELEAFSFSVSHDLQAPLRTIDVFSKALIDGYGDKMDAKAQSHILRVRSASTRMADLIQDMMRLAQVTRYEMARRQVDLSALAREVTDGLRRTNSGRDNVEFIIAEGVVADGDDRLLKIVLENLFNNAWKFTSKHSGARIEFGTLTQTDGARAYFVRDDGAGFDMDFAEKLFASFRRMRTDAEFPGTGVGLATVQRIINRHAGRIWAESSVEQGAAFYFTL